MASDILPTSVKHPKLPKLPQHAVVTKRRLTRQPIISKDSSHKESIIYISTKTPFMSAITRIRKRVSQVQKRRSQSVAATSSKRNSQPLNKAKGDRILAAAIESLDRQDAAMSAAMIKAGASEEVLLKGTGKAIEKVLDIAGWLQNHSVEEGIRVKLETGSWWAIDDVEIPEEEEPSGSAMDIDQAKLEDANRHEAEVPDSRLRSVSVLTLRVVVL